MGLASIPDDILSEVFEHGLGSYVDDPTTSKETLSLVCRRFRRVVVNTPRLWSRINRQDKIPYMRACLERSKSVGLSISLAFNDADSLDCALSLLAEVTPHMSRWEHLRVEFELDEALIANHEEVLRSTIASNLHLPSLRALSLEYTATQEEYAVFANDDIRHFYQSWEMPNLRSLDSSTIPTPFIAPKLSSIHLYRSHISGGPATNDRLRDFLAACPKLEELTLRFIRTGARGYPRSHLMQLPNLTTLRVRAFSCDARDVRPFLRALQAPKLRRLDIETLTMRYDVGLTHVLDNFLPHEVYPALEDLSLHMFPDDRKATGFDLTFEKFPALRTLSLDTPNFVPFIPLDYFHVPSLRTLKIAYCSNMHIHWLEHLREILTRQGLWSGFKQLEISSALDSSSVRRINTLYGEENKDIVWGAEREEIGF